MALLAAALSLVLLAVHLVLGGRDIARPLRRDRGLPPEARAVAWVCWHYVSATILLMAAFLAVGAWAGRPVLIGAGTALAAAFAVLGIALPPALGWSYRLAPQGWLFLPVALLGALAL